MANAGGMTGTINLETHEIYIAGALSDRDNVNTVIQVNILGVPPGRYSVTKVEYNGQSVSWNVWALRFGFGVTYDATIAQAGSNYFTKIKWVPDRNCLVFYGGVVSPKQVLVKRWGIDYKGGGPIVVQHYERTTQPSGTEEVTDEEVAKGWGDRPVEAVINLTLQVISGSH
ncbi:DUF6423 family protein [Mesorhizobium sp. M0494]|uniref:DUF6423 family protein n=1 Tax=Mesorhizobium sp. M0494 TaxID=2956951 RepID=UPI00333D9A25